MATVEENAVPAGPQRESSPAIALHQALRWRGVGFGFRQPTLVATIGISDRPALDQATLSLPALLSGRLPLREHEEADRQLQAADTTSRTVDVLVRMVEAIFTAADQPVEGPGRLVGQVDVDAKQGGGSRLVRLAIPSMNASITELALAWSATCVNRMVEIAGVPEPEALFAGLHSLLQTAQQAGSDDAAARNLVRAALSLGIPSQRIPGGTLQLGWGSRSRLLRGGSTDQTSVVGTFTALDKLASSSFLRACGVPVPDNRYVPDLATAIEAAQALGFPVAVKPVDRDRGEGATADVRDEPELVAAFERARAESSHVLVEKHVTGREFRIMVVDGEVFWAFERVPAQVVGDGEATVEELVARLNAGRSGNAPGRKLQQPVPIATDLHHQLERQGLLLDSVPEDGRTVRLQSVPRVAGGGAVVPAFDDLHPDNAAIAVWAARLLRLNIAGIDFLATDATRSWKETGGRIIEVNAVPQFSNLSRKDIYEAFLRKIISGQGTVPVALCLGGPPALHADLENELSKTGLRAGLATRSHFKVLSDQISGRTGGLFDSAQILSRDPCVDAIVVLCEIDDLLKDGVPLERIDVLALCVDFARPESGRILHNLLQPHISGSVVTLESEHNATAIGAGLDSRRLKRVRNEKKLAEAIRREIVAAA